MRIPLMRLLLALVFSTAAGQTAQAPFSIDVSGPKTVKAGVPFYIKIVLTNTSDHSLDFKSHDPEEFDYSTEVFKSNGQSDDYTTYGYLMATGKCDPKYGAVNGVASCARESGAPIPVTLQAGGKYITRIFVTDQFHLSKPGDYLIRVSRSTVGNPGQRILVKSNTITVTVTP
jgi:hypothetical protein